MSAYSKEKMVFPAKRNKKRGKQFRLVKFFAYASFLVLIIFSLPFSMVISQRAKDILMKSHETYALLLGENLNHQVFQNFVLPVTQQYGKMRLREKHQQELMDRIVKNTTHSFKIDVVNIYDINQGVIAYSTDPELIGKKVRESLGYKKAVKGENSSRLVSEGDGIWGIGIRRLGAEKKLRTYIPFMGTRRFLGDTGQVLGVFELIQDLTAEYESLVRFQYLIFGLSIVIMGMIFVALLFIVHKAEKIIGERAREQRELETQLDQAERLAALGQMVAGVSHEIRNPLGIIRSTAELMGSMSSGNESQAKLSGLIVEESSRLNNIVTEFLDFARPQTPNFQDCDLNEILHKNIQFLQRELETRKILLQDGLPHRSLPLKADPQLLYRSFLNIFMNALQAMEDGGTLSISVSEDEDYYVVAVQDDGSGIEEQDLKKIFDPFFSTKDKGSGLGLSIVRNIIEGHKGHIWIESHLEASAPEETGTSVFIQLPKQ
ncbi:ATPase/histidine kinase/DNA gyrase B/HSP90 domain protein [delta proteobacterium NaphS2]|nr:ATPase/histidine kinase/DNA gyrase B/HSP90 domain protein [delta proteobacterium NaphS2]